MIDLRLVKNGKSGHISGKSMVAIQMAAQGNVAAHGSNTGRRREGVTMDIAGELKFLGSGVNWMPLVADLMALAATPEFKKLLADLGV